MVEGDVDERESFEEGVVDAVAEGDVECCKADCGVHEHELDGTDEGFKGNVAGFHVRLVDFGLRLESGIVGEFSQSLCTSEEDVGGGCLREEE